MNKTTLITALSLFVCAAVVANPLFVNEILVQGHFVKDSHLAELEKFCIHPDKEEHHQYIKDISPEIKTWIENEIVVMMTELGFQQVPNHQCELEIGYALKVKEQAMLHAPRIAHSDILPETIDLIPERTLVIHAHDLHLDRTLWVASAQEVVLDDAPEKQEPEAIKSRLEYAFEKFARQFPSLNRNQT